SFSDYQFLVVEGDAAANFVQRSPLSAYPVESAIPGAIGYFQVDAEGTLTTPLLPSAEGDAERYGISADERRARLALEATNRDVLVENRLVQRDDVLEGLGGVSLDEAGPRASAPPSAEYRETPGGGRSGSVQDAVRRSDASAAQSVAVQAAFDRLKAGVEPSRPEDTS